MTSEQFSLRLPQDTNTLNESWQVCAIKQGLKDIDNSDIITLENIKKDWNIER